MNRAGLRHAYLAVTFAAAAIGCLWFGEGYPTVIYDSWGYYYLSEFLRTKGLVPWPVDYRTYGYPFFLALVSGFRGLPQEELRLVVFFVQLSAYLGTCAYVARRIAAILRSEAAGLAAYAVAALNPVLLLHTTETLSDLLSAVLIQLAVAVSWKTPSEGRTARPALCAPFLAFFCAGLATAVRPANAAVACALALVWAVRLIRWRERLVASAFAAIVGLALPLVPQMVVNYGIARKLNPLLVRSLYRDQRLWGMKYLKYGTVVMPDHSPFLIYTNPFYRGDPGPRTFLRNHPAGYLATLALHAFGMVDADLPFTYITNLKPWYRWPLSIVNYGLLYLGLLGCVWAAARWASQRRIDEIEFVVLSTILVGAAYALLYLPVEVENRFGLTLLMLTTPLVVLSGRWLLGRGRGGSRARRLAILGAPLFVLACAWLSIWISTQQTNPFVSSPANAQVLDPKRARLAGAPVTPTLRP
jgi:hypothetical protein